MDRGTLYQLKILINRSSVPSQPDKDMKAAEDFLDVVIHALVMAAAGMLCNQREINSVAEMAGGIFKTYINLQLGKSTSVPCNDGIYLYACDLLMLGMIWMGFHDATREGDGERVLTYWKFLLPIFKVLGRKNYSIEAVQQKDSRLNSHGQDSLIHMVEKGLISHVIYTLSILTGGSKLPLGISGPT